MSTLLERNRAFARTDARRRAPAIPFSRKSLYIVTCIDYRVDPAAILGLELGDAIVQRVVGGRVTRGVIEDIAYISYLIESKFPNGPWFEVAVIHHTDCGSALLANDRFRHGFARRAGVDEHALADRPVLDPARTVSTDVERLLRSREICSKVAVSGHVYDVETGLLSTVVDVARESDRGTDVATVH